MVTDRVGEAGDIEPPDRHAFAEVRGREQPVDLFFVSVRGVVLYEARDFFRGGWQT